MLSSLRTIAFFILALIVAEACAAQSTRMVADSIRKAYQIPELAYAIVSPNKILELNVLGEKQINTGHAAELNDHFKIGSNTKAITGFIAALLVKRGQITWDTKFFDLFPELKSTSRKVYLNTTLVQLLSMRSRLRRYTYTDTLPSREQIRGTEDEQRYQFAKYFLQQKAALTKGVNLSNTSYVLAALMLEKASGKKYQELVSELGTQLGSQFGFGMPNAQDSTQPSGHNAQLQAVTSIDDYKLNWLQAAGNIHVSLPDYVKFIQALQQCLSGNSTLLSKDESEFLLFALPEFSIGWFHELDRRHQRYAYNEGNPGSFLSKVYVFDHLAFILFANAQTDRADQGLGLLYDILKKQYSQQ